MLTHCSRDDTPQDGLPLGACVSLLPQQVPLLLAEGAQGRVLGYEGGAEGGGLG